MTTNETPEQSDPRQDRDSQPPRGPLGIPTRSLIIGGGGALLVVIAVLVVVMSGVIGGGNPGRDLCTT